MSNPRCFLDFAIEGEAVGRVVFELFADVVPKTAENFRSLCTGSRGVTLAGVPLYYKGSLVHRIIAGFMVQMGDFTQRNGKGGESIYGGTFDDEDLRREIDSEGLLVMANRGRNTNGSQFFVSLRPCPHLAGKHVVFGRVVKGYEVVEGLSRLPVTEKDVPLQLVTISNCGELVRKVVPKKRTPSPVRSRSASVSEPRSGSRSRSPSKSPNRSPITRSPSESPVETTTKRQRSSKHRERDENGKRIHKKHKSSHSKDKSKEKKDNRGKKHPKEAEKVVPTAEDLELIEAKKKLQEEEEERQRQQDKARQQQRLKELEEIKKRYEKNGGGPGVVYKGRGAMKAPESRGGMRGWDQKN